MPKSKDSPRKFNWSEVLLLPYKSFVGLIIALIVTSMWRFGIDQLADSEILYGSLLGPIVPTPTAIEESPNRIPTPISPTPSPTPTLRGRYYPPEIGSPSSNYTARLLVTAPENGSYPVQLLVAGWDTNYAVVGNDADQVFTQVDYKVPTRYTDYLDLLYYPTSYRDYSIDHYNQLVTWSADETQLAFVHPESIYLYSFQKIDNFVSEELSGTYTQILQSESVTEISLLDSGYFENGFSPEGVRLFFSGDGNELYLATVYDLYRYTIATDTWEELPSNDYYSSLSAHPIPNQSGYIMWTPGEEQYRAALTTYQNGEETTYQTTGGSIDYHGKILLSPDATKACIEWGASGYWGYMVFDLQTSDTLADGGQYSYCRKWLNNNELIVIENPYFHQTVDSWFTINVLTNERILIENRPSKRAQ